MAVSYFDRFPNEILRHIASFSSLPTAVQIARTCTLLYNDFLRRIDSLAALEQLRMGMPVVPFTFANVHSIMQNVLRTWINRSPQECKVIRTNLMNQPLEVYVRLNPLAPIALDNLSDEWSTSFHQWAISLQKTIQQEREIHLLEIVQNENLPWEIALEVVDYIQKDSVWKIIDYVNRAIGRIASRADVPWKKAKELALSINTSKPCISNPYLHSRELQERALAIIASRADIPREEALEIVITDFLHDNSTWQNYAIERIATRDAEIANMGVDQGLDAMDQSPTVEKIVISPTEKAALLQLKDMIQQSEIQYSHEDYLSILEGLSGETQDLIYKMLYQAHDSPFGEIDKDGIQHILSNPQLLLPIINQLT